MSDELRALIAQWRGDGVIGPEAWCEAFAECADELESALNATLSPVAVAQPVAVTLGAIREAVARGWCHPLTSNRIMDVDLANAIAREVLAALAAERPAGGDK